MKSKNETKVVLPGFERIKFNRDTNARGEAGHLIPIRTVIAVIERE